MVDENYWSTSTSTSLEYEHHYRRRIQEELEIERNNEAGRRSARLKFNLDDFKDSLRLHTEAIKKEPEIVVEEKEFMFDPKELDI